MAKKDGSPGQAMMAQLGGKGGAKAGGEQGGSGGKGLPVVFLIVAAMVVIISAAGGWATATILAGGQTDAADNEEIVALEDTPPPEGEDMSYIDLDPITVNIDVPRVSRYIRASFTLAIKEGDFAEAEKWIKKHDREIRNDLQVYLAGLTLDDVRGEKNINRVRREVADKLNEKLWPDRRPRVNHVLLKEWAIQ